MKQILIIDESPLVREYLRLKLDVENIEVITAINALDGISKIRTQVPDLIIMDYYLKKASCLEVLKQKKESPNTVNTPVIIIAQHIDQSRIINLLPYNVKKVFTKPIKIDALCTTITEILGIPFGIDESPGIVEVHVNDNIIFVEIAQGLNRDKLDLLHFKIRELIVLYKIRLPKIIVMLSDIILGFADGLNIQKLLKVILGVPEVERQNLRILTKDAFLRKFIEEQTEYDGIEVVSNLQYAMDGLIDEFADPAEYEGKEAELIEEKVLSADTRAHGETIQLRFKAEAKSNRKDIQKIMSNLKIAVVDDDFMTQELIKFTFKSVGSSVKIYSDGDEFLADGKAGHFDLIFLDLLMPKVDGFSVLRALKTGEIYRPIIVLSAVSQRNTVIQAFQMGIKSYLIKPLTADAIFTNAMEILRSSF
ncbi:MAG: response regulator [Spirochaetaceae bacterium]|jgi:DNA-binding response OmpR family regulator|nr:response regulator [Spirochaetaceae bacterium]